MIPEHPSWEIRDSSKLKDYEECPRKFFFIHILGWRIDTAQHDLYFGECWHVAREHMLIKGYDDMTGAFDAFLKHYRKEFGPLTDSLYRPKDPEAVALAIATFAGKHQRDLIDNEVLYTEISGSVPIDESRVVYFRMDSVLRNKEKGHIFSWDHKSTKKFSRQWQNQFYLSLQNGTYTHCLYCMYPDEMKNHLIKGVEFCGTQFEFLKRGSGARTAGYHIGFQRVPAWKLPSQMNVWLWNIVDLIDDLDRDMERLSHCNENDLIMAAFRMRTDSCTKYYGCMFHDYCMAWDNPLRECDEPPLGFRQEFWDPREMETTNKMELEWK